MKMLIALLALTAAPAHAEAWTKVAGNALGVDYFIKDQDIRNGANSAPLIWVKTDNRRESNPRWASSLSQIRFDCPKQSLQLFAVYTYEADGKVKDVQSFPLGQRRTTSIPAGSIWSEVARLACPR